MKMIIAILSMATAFSSYALDIDIDVTSDLIIEKIESKLTAKSIKELPHLDMVVITEPKGQTLKLLCLAGVFLVILQFNPNS